MSSVVESVAEVQMPGSILGPQKSNKKPPTNGLMDERILQMMVKMGYKGGSVLGKNKQGTGHPIHMQVQFDRNGLGLSHQSLTFDGENWDPSLNEANVNEEIRWFENKSGIEQNCTLIDWIQKAPPITEINNETQFVDSKLLSEILDAKKIFDELNPVELSKARARANPFETIRYAFFMNRAALKMANIDSATNFMFTEIDRNPNHRRENGVYYFADVCAGPGGFSEYILWRKKWSFKGFGFTLKGEHDFKLHDSQCASGVTFQPYYGLKNDGNVCNLDNVADFAGKVLHQTGGLGVHFMMADGGFSVEGNENLQEVLSKQLYVSQCLVALEIVRTNGHFVTKMFDLFTPFSIGLIFLMSKCFKEVAIFKPNASRPANSERYFICKGFNGRDQSNDVKNYLRKIVEELWHLKSGQKSHDITEIVPLHVLKSDPTFFNYIVDSNNKIGEKQRNGLLNLAKFCRNPLLVDPRQDILRAQSLHFWKIPDRPRPPTQRFTIDDLISSSVSRREFMLVQPREINDIESFKNVIDIPSEWNFVLLASTKNCNYCNFYAGLGGGRGFKLQGSKWTRVKNLKLCKGSLLYAELVKEQETLSNNKEIQHNSLHIIDALRLGDTSLIDLPFVERLHCIRTYCEAINFESVPNKFRIRPKITTPLTSLDVNSMCYRKEQYSVKLPTLGLQSIGEYYYVNSLLLVKTDEHQSFDSTYVLRVQVYINDDFCSDIQTGSYVKLNEIINYIKNNC